MDELLVVDAAERVEHWIRRAGEGDEAIDRSGPVAPGPAELAPPRDSP